MQARRFLGFFRMELRVSTNEGIRSSRCLGHPAGLNSVCSLFDDPAIREVFAPDGIVPPSVELG